MALLTCGAVLTLIFEVAGSAHPVPAAVIGVVFAVIAVQGFRWLDRKRRGRVRLWLSVVYVGGLLGLGFALFSFAGAGVGSTLLLMVLVSQSVRLLPLVGAAAVTAAVPLVHVGMTWTDGLRNGLGTLAAAAFTAVVTELLQREQRARAELARANSELRRMAAQAEQLATTQERNRLARDIHDGLGHHLTVVQMQIQAARAVLAVDPVRADAVLANAQQQSAQALAEIRRSVSVLREPRAVPALRTALEALADEAAAAGMPTEVRVAGTVRLLPAEVEESLFRAAQEGLTNVRKHAGASHAQLVLDYQEGGTTQLVVRDDGSGLTTDKLMPGTGFGILGLRERAARLSGSLNLESAPGEGTTLRLIVPG